MQLELTQTTASHAIAALPFGHARPDAVTAEIALCAGMTVLTLAGEVAAQDLVPGARIITRDTGVATLRAVSFSQVTTGMIRFKAGSLGHTRPDRDTLTLPGTRIHLRDWRAQAMARAAQASIAAQDLVDDEFVAEEQVAAQSVVTLHFDRAHVIYADGLEIAAGA